jgi:SAM-dependent methyltransferase
MKPKKQDYKNIWKEFGQDYKIHGPSSRHTRRILRKYLSLVGYNSIIDIGCGPGILLSTLDLKGKFFAGADLSESGIRFCKERWPKGNFKIIDIAKEAPKERYDVAVCSEVLEHIKDDLAAMKNLRKTCDNLVISVPAGKYSFSDHEMGHFRRYTKEDMISKLKRAGFKIVKCEYWGFPFYSPIYRFFLNNTKVKQRAGKVTIFKRLISEILNIMFYLNIPNKGDRLFVLAR